MGNECKAQYQALAQSTQIATECIGTMMDSIHQTKMILKITIFFILIRENKVSPISVMPNLKYIKDK